MTLRCGISGAVASDFDPTVGDAGLRFEDARRNCVLFGVPLLETFRFERDCLVRSAGDDCRSFRTLATEGDLDGDFGVWTRGGDRDSDLVKGVAGCGGADSGSSGACVMMGDKDGGGGLSLSMEG
jgi:hypothetical protein